MERLDPKLDVVFKLLFTREKALLIDMLEGILVRPIQEIEILNPGIPGELSSDKKIVLDIRVVLDDGSRVDVEMQIRTSSSLASRLVYYAARDYADQLGRGEDYDRLTPTIVIVWMVEPLFEEQQRLHSIFELRERHTHLRFGNQLAIHILQLSCLSPSVTTGYTARVERWARFLVTRDDTELDRLASEDPIMSTAKDTLDQLSQDPATYRLARERADAIKLHKIEMATDRAEARAEGLAEGLAEGETTGKAQLLLKLLGLRFGDLPEPIRVRVETATSERLESWAERVLTVGTLEDVFAPSP